MTRLFALAACVLALAVPAQAGHHHRGPVYRWPVVSVGVVAPAPVVYVVPQPVAPPPAPAPVVGYFYLRIR